MTPHAQHIPKVKTDAIPTTEQPAIPAFDVKADGPDLDVNSRE